MNERRPRANPFANLVQALAEAIAEAEAAALSPQGLPPMSDPGLDTGAALGDEAFNEAARAEEGLRLLVLLTMPDSRLFRGWRRYDGPSEPVEVAASLADLVLSLRRVMISVGGPPDDLWTVLESPDAMMLVRPFRLDFALCALFGQPANQGSARVSMRRLIKQIEPALPAPSVELSF